MNFDIVINELDEEMSGKLPLVKELSTLTNKFYLGKFYGNDLKSLRLIFILIKTKQGYEEWFKVRKPKYTEYNVIETFSGQKIEINKEFAIEYRIDNEIYDSFLKATDGDSKKILAQEILNSLSNLDALPKKVKDFDKKAFINDLEIFLTKEIMAPLS
jgi:hypothetical protein